MNKPLNINDTVRLGHGSRLAVILFFCVFALPLCATEHVAVLAPKVFHRSLEPWIKHRTEQGYTVHVLVEPFGEGSTTPEKVKERVRMLAEQVSLTALLIVGNGAARSEERRERVIPSPRFSCRIIQQFGQEDHFASDDWYADLDDDGLPDFALGRLTADSPEELDAMIRKTVYYETRCEAGIWCRRLQIVAGVGNFSPLVDGAIESTARYALTETLPASWEMSLLHAQWRSPFCPAPIDYPAALIESLDRGSLFWVYLGHGHHRRLEPLATPLGAVEALDVDRFPTIQCRDAMPIALLFCCYGGTLDAGTRGLAEELLLQTEGPVAVVAASRTTMPYGMGVFGIELLQETLRQSEARTLGAIVLEAKHRMIRPKPPGETEPGQGPRRRPIRENLETLAKLLDPTADRLPEQLEEHAALFHLFGDPLLQLPEASVIRLECPGKVRSGSMSTVSGTLPETLAGERTVRIELAVAPERFSLTSPRRESFHPEARREDNDEYRRVNEQVVLSRETTSRPDGSFSLELPIPSDIRGPYVVRAFTAAGRSYALGAARVSIH